jgi:K+-sensing histidine kinase KdpD
MRVLVCVTVQKSCDRLIEYGARIAREQGAALTVLHVAGLNDNFLGNPAEGEALECLYEISSSHGAEMTVRRATDVVGEIASYARSVKATAIVMGQSRHSERDIPGQLRALMPDIDVRVLYPQTV